MVILHKIFHTSFIQSNNSSCLIVSQKVVKIAANQTIIAHGAWIFKISANQKQELLMVTMIFLSNRDEMRKSYRGHSIKYLPTKFRFIWPSGIRGEHFLEIDQPEKRIVYGGHVC